MQKFKEKYLKKKHLHHNIFRLHHTCNNILYIGLESNLKTLIALLSLNFCNKTRPWSLWSIFFIEHSWALFKLNFKCYLKDKSMKKMIKDRVKYVNKLKIIFATYVLVLICHVCVLCIFFYNTRDYLKAFLMMTSSDIYFYKNNWTLVR